VSDELVVVGLSHHTAPVSLRERLSVPPDATEEQLRCVLDTRVLREGMLVSTCNRVEFYGAGPDAEAGLARLRKYLHERGHPEPVQGHLYERRGEDAVRHVFRVAASLDSMVVGEPQILGQVKHAYELAQDVGSIGTLLDRCLTRAFAVAKRVRSETEIAAGTVSVSSIACDLATKIFGDLSGRRTLLLGAGEMGEAAARALAGRGVHLVVINRSPEKAVRLARESNGEARGYEHLASELVSADVVISSTSAKNYVLTHDLMKDVVKARRQRPLFLIDIAVPRDVEPRVGELPSVFLYDVDDLSQVADQNLAHRQQEVEAAAAIVELEVAAFERWRRTLDLTPTIVALRGHFTNVMKEELARTLPRLGELGPTEQKSLDKMCQAMVNKLLHQPLTQLKEGVEGGNGAALLEATRRLFDLDELAHEAAPTPEVKPTAATSAAPEAEPSPEIPSESMGMPDGEAMTERPAAALGGLALGLSPTNLSGEPK